MDIAAELRELAKDLWWCWHPEAIALFRDLDPTLWRRANHNPVAFLDAIDAEHLKQRASELVLETRINFTHHRLHEYKTRQSTWGCTYAGCLKINPVAYFSAEFGIHESIPFYSGGLGILAGDHLKSCSDLGLPVVGVGLLYAQGYFNQHLDGSGWQQEGYNETEVGSLPVEPARDREGKPLRVFVETRTGRIGIAVWTVPVGRVRLVLLDSDVEGNSEADRKLAGRLYGGDVNTRIRQETILGVGGLRALVAMGIKPGVLHLNEGHSAFATLEMARQEMETDRIGFGEALARVKARTVFTTHTPDEAGHDRFDGGLMEQTLGPLREALGLSWDDLMGLGRVNPRDGNELFCMTVLGFRAAWKANGVSALHGGLTRRMWQGLWPGRPEFEVPVGHITNGVHAASWLAPAMQQMFDTYLGADWQARMCSPSAWKPIGEIDDSELWEAHQIIKARLIHYVTRQVNAQEAARGAEVGDVSKRRLDPTILTIGFAKRFAQYKRGDLILRDEQRLERLISHPERPIQIIFAGKAHPRNDAGKHLIQRIFRLGQDPRFRGRILFLEDYDINVARHMIQGVDVWLNTPIRPKEACGTSGMKAIFNGVLNLSILDGWWAEGYDGTNGFAIGAGTQHANGDEQDRRDTRALFDVVENEVIPLYYSDRDGDGIPRGWVKRMKNAIQTLAWRFTADRMALEYMRDCYMPSVGSQPPGQFNGR